MVAHRLAYVEVQTEAGVLQLLDRLSNISHFFGGRGGGGAEFLIAFSSTLSSDFFKWSGL